MATGKAVRALSIRFPTDAVDAAPAGVTPTANRRHDTQPYVYWRDEANEGQQLTL